MTLYTSFCNLDLIREFWFAIIVFPTQIAVSQRAKPQKWILNHFLNENMREELMSESPTPTRLIKSHPRKSLFSPSYFTRNSAIFIVEFESFFCFWVLWLRNALGQFRARFQPCPPWPLPLQKIQSKGKVQIFIPVSSRTWIVHFWRRNASMAVLVSQRTFILTTLLSRTKNLTNPAWILLRSNKGKMKFGSIEKMPEVWFNWKNAASYLTEH